MGERMHKDPMSNLSISNALFIGVLLLSAACGVHAQRVVVPSALPKQTTLPAFTQKLARHLESAGYTNVTLIPTDRGVQGSAVRNGRRVQISLDESGLLHTQDAM
jgi:hypothetical protein